MVLNEVFISREIIRSVFSLVQLSHRQGCSHHALRDQQKHDHSNVLVYIKSQKEYLNIQYKKKKEVEYKHAIPENYHFLKTHPASELGNSIFLIVCDQIRLHVLHPEANACQDVIWLIWYHCNKIQRVRPLRTQTYWARLLIIITITDISRAHYPWPNLRHSHECTVLYKKMHVHTETYINSQTTQRMNTISLNKCIHHQF